MRWRVSRRLMQRMAAALPVLLLASAAVAQDADAKDPIDVALDSCLAASEGQSTAGMVDCFGAAGSGWDSALNTAYGELMHGLDAKSATLLKTSQRQWLAWRDAEKSFLAGPWSTARGSIVQVERVQAITAMVRSRTLLLRSYLPEQH